MNLWQRNFLIFERIEPTLGSAALAFWMIWLDKIPGQMLLPEKALPIVSALATLFSAMLKFLLEIIIFCSAWSMLRTLKFSEQAQPTKAYGQFSKAQRTPALFPQP